MAGLRGGGALEVLGVFLRLGLTSFGGPAAHLGYFHAEFVRRRRWLGEQDYADLVALCQFLPGPASSQFGMAVGLGRAGWPGALAAWLGFTLPSALLLIAFALGARALEGPAATGVIHGLKVVAVAVVAQAVWGMSRSLCPDRPRAGIALAAAGVTTLLPGAGGQLGAIALGGLVARWALPVPPLPAAQHPDYGVSRRQGAALLALCAGLLVALPLLASLSGAAWLAVVAVLFKAGALVFGGGHVVLPLLQAGVVPPGWVSEDVFLAGYGAAQAVPGPLFSFAAYLGAAMGPPLGGWAGGGLLLVAIFAPSFLLLAGVLPFWEALRHRDAIRRALAGVNAAVVGVLGATLHDPLWSGSIHGRADFCLALAAYGLLVVARVPPVAVVALCALAGGLGAVWG